MTDCPDPSHLEAYAKEPVFFGDLDNANFTVTDDTRIIYEREYPSERDASYPGEASVSFEFVPGYINVEVERGEYVRAEETDVDVDHGRLWKNALDVEIRDDYIVALVFLYPDNGPVMAEGYWLLDEVSFKTAAIDRSQ